MSYHFARGKTLLVEPPRAYGPDTEAVVTSTTDRLGIGGGQQPKLHFSSGRIDSDDPMYIANAAVLTEAALAQFNEDNEATAATPGSLLTAGDSLGPQHSPWPFAFIDKRARVISRNIWDDDIDLRGSIMGFAAEGKGPTHNHGLCPAGHVEHAGQFLRRDGIWATPAAATPGTVAEVITQLNDVETGYTPNAVLECRYDSSFAQGIGYVKSRDLSLATVTCTGDITANSFISRSDERLKSGITPLTPEASLQKIQSLNPVQYVFKDDDSSRLHTGLLAQEVRERSEMPEIALGDPAIETLKVDYGSIISTLVGAVKHLADRVTERSISPVSSIPTTPQTD